MSALTLRLNALKHAKYNVGNVEEGGNNRGPKVNRYITYAGGDIGEPWCVDGVIWCYGHAGSSVVKRGFPRAVRYMYPHDGVAQVAVPHAGNVVRYTFDHTEVYWYPCDALGRRRLWRFASHIKTIGFNTGADGITSDGHGEDGVHVRIRPKYLVRDYLRVLR